MATKKYVSLEKLDLYDDKIKKVISDSDATVLASAKSYADGLATNYDAAGSASTVQGNLDTEIARAKAEESRIAGLVATAQSEVDALELVVDTKADKTALEGFQTTVASTYETKEDAGSKLTEAKTYTDTEVKKVQDAVDAVEVLVGEVPEGSTVVEMIGAVEDVADANAGEISTLKGKVEALEAGTYDDAEVRGLISANAEAIEALEGTHGTDKAALEAAIALKADATALNEEIERAKAAEKANADEIARVNGVLANALENDGEGLDSIKELATWVNEHGQEAAEMTAAIGQNADDIDALEGRMDSAEAALNTVDSRIEAAITGADLGKYALDSDLDAAVERIAGLETADGEQDTLIAGLRTDVDAKASNADHELLVGRVGTVEGKVTTLEGKVDVEKVSTAIAAAKDEVIADATTKANTAESNAKTYVDGEIDKVEERVGALETASATHALKSEVEAVAGRVTTVEGKVSTLEGEMDAVQALADAADKAAKANAEALKLKASQADLDNAVTRIVAVETWQANMIECSEEEIAAMFA